MADKELQQFRQSFCEKAASLGVTPSELVSYIKYANSLETTKQAFSWGSAGKFLGDNLWAAVLASLAAGASLGGLTAYGVHKTQTALDPSGDLLGDEDNPLAEAKKVQLIAKYRNAAQTARKAVD